METSIVLFDFGNVLARWDPAPRIAEYARQAGLTPAEVRERLNRNDFATNSDRGRYSAAEIVDHLREVLGCGFSEEELVRLQAAAFELRPAVLSVARSVARSHRVGVLTNNSPLFAKCLGAHFPEVVDLFHPILLSSQLGYIKPERELYAAVQHELGFSGSQISFIDDTAGHVVAAASVGWRCFHYRTDAKLERQLANAGLVSGAVQPGLAAAKGQRRGNGPW